MVTGTRSLPTTVHIAVGIVVRLVTSMTLIYYYDKSRSNSPIDGAFERS
jgi:hypothetical protein